MHPFFQNVLDRPKNQKIGIWIGSLLLISFLFWQFFYKAQLDQAEQLEDHVAELDKKVADEKRRAANLKKMREMVKDLDLKLNAALLELPDGSNIANLIDSVSDLARDAGLEITLFDRKDEKKKDFYAEVPVAVSVEGNYHQIATFFDEVGHIDRIVNINQISLHGAKVTESDVSVKADCVATAFRYMDEEERRKLSQDEQATQDAGRRRK